MATLSAGAVCQSDSESYQLKERVTIYVNRESETPAGSRQGMSQRWVFIVLRVDRPSVRLLSVWLDHADLGKAIQDAAREG